MNNYGIVFQFVSVLLGVFVICGIAATCYLVIEDCLLAWRNRNVRS